MQIALHPASIMCFKSSQHPRCWADDCKSQHPRCWADNCKLPKRKCNQPGPTILVSANRLQLRSNMFECSQPGPTILDIWLRFAARGYSFETPRQVSQVQTLFREPTSNPLFMAVFGKCMPSPCMHCVPS